MDPPTLDRENVLARYDDLLSSGELLYTPSTSVVNLTDNGFPVSQLALSQFDLTTRRMHEADQGNTAIVRIPRDTCTTHQAQLPRGVKASIPIGDPI